MTSSLRVSRPSELLSLIPYQLGSEPEESVVVVSLRGERKQVGLVARVDIAGLIGDENLTLAHQLREHCLADGAAQVVIVAYGTSSTHGNANLEAQFLAVQMLAAYFDPYIPMLEHWVVDGGRYGHFAVDEECTESSPAAYRRAIETKTRIDMCTLHSASTQDFKNTQVAARMVFEGNTAKPSRDDVGLIEPAQQQLVDETGQHYGVMSNYLKTATQDEVGQWKDASLKLWFEHLESSETGQHSLSVLQTDQSNTALAARFARALEFVDFRDAVLVGFTSQGTDGAQQFLQMSALGSERASVDTIARAAIAEITDPNLARQPDSDVVYPVINMLERIIVFTSTEQQVTPRALLGLLSWWSGNGAIARRHLEEALAIDPECGLAKLVDSALNFGLAPGWQRTNG